jgi:hypothetical protein
MVDVDCAVGYTPCLTAADDLGYEIDEAEVVYWGRCPECVAATSVTSDGRGRIRGTRHELSKAALDLRATDSRVASHQKEPATEEKDHRA